MHSYFLDVSYEVPEYVYIVPRDTIPLVVVVAYVPVLSGNVDGVDIVNCSCQSLILLVILSVHMSIVLYSLPLHIQSSRIMHRACIADQICVRTNSMYKYTVRMCEHMC